MGIAKDITLQMPDMKDRLISAGINKKPEEYVQGCLKNAFVMSLLLSILLTFYLLKLKKSIFLIVPIFLVIFAFFLFIFIKRVDITIAKREREIDRDVLFAGRFLLVKLNSGRPLINSIMDASNSYGVASKFFREIVKDIELGTPMEDALQKAYKHSPSRRFRKILFQINNALKIGVDVSVPLEATLEEIADEQLVEIQRYGKKLNSLTMFYMLVAIVVPSLGITLFSVVATMVAIKVDMSLLILVIFFLVIVQMLFISFFKSLRPNLNI
jgi:pilus assembly protein TadC